MAVLANESGMSSEGNIEKRDSSHDFNVYVDRQLQNKLIQAAEDVEHEDYERKLLKPGHNMKKTNKMIDSKAEDITGWFTDAKFVARRNNDGAKTESKPQKETFIHPWRDYRDYRKKEESFIFKHYSDTKKYIEQYRNDHGCHGVRNTSGGQAGDSRRHAFQSSAAPAPPPQQTVQVTVQDMLQGNYNINSSSSSSSALQYTNRKELQPQPPSTANPTCNCGRASHIQNVDTSNLAHKYKFSPSLLTRTNTEVRPPPCDSDNSSESGDFRSKTPVRRISSAASARSKQSLTVSRTPTKISVPANPNARPYPIQALTIAWRLHQRQQHNQNGRPEGSASGKPLDNLNCVAPEKQMMYIGRKEVEPVGFSLNVHNIHDLLTANEAPLRGYALPKSSPPTPKRDSIGSPASDIDSILDDDADVISLDQLSTCPLGADVYVKPRPLDQQTTDMLQMFFSDPILSQLNQRPRLKGDISQNMFPSQAYFGSDHICMPQNDPDGISRVNMWNPIISTTPVSSNHEPTGQTYRHLMQQSPFRKPSSETRLPKTVQMDLSQARSYSGSRRDYFNPVNNVKLSITKLDNGVSFCRTSVETSSETSKKPENQQHKHTKSKNSNPAMPDTFDITDRAYETPQSRQKVQFYDPYQDGKGKMLKPDQKINLPLPKVKIFESVPSHQTFKSNNTEMGELPKVETRILADNDRSDNLHIENDLECETISNAKTSVDNVKIASTHNPLEKSKTETALLTIKHSLENAKIRDKNGFCNDIVKGVKIAVEKRHHMSDHMNNNNGRTMDKRGHEHQSNNHRSTRKTTRKPSVASGKYLKTRPEFEGLTWSEKLEVLRSVNKPPDKPKTKRPKLKFVKDEPEGVWTTEQEQLYEQRRIKHLVEQARIKGGKQFDWVYNTQSKGVDWETGKLKVDNSESSGEVSGSDEGDLEQEGVSKLGKYGIYVPPKGTSHKLFSSQSVPRSNTYVSH